MPDAYVPVLAEEAAIWFLRRRLLRLLHQLRFRSGGGVAQAAYGEEMAASIDRFTAPWFEHRLVPEWIPAMPDVRAVLEAGATVCDVGGGRGRALIKLAEAFPPVPIRGYRRVPASDPRRPRESPACRSAGPGAIRGGRHCRQAARAVRRHHYIRRDPRLGRSSGNLTGHP
jgi:hypothetical protein